MGIKFFKLGLLITVALIFMCATCRKDGTTPCSHTSYVFNVNCVWTQQKEVYLVGDTIFLSSSFPKNLIDQVGNYNVDFSNSVGIYGGLSIVYLDTLTHQPTPARDSFAFAPITGNFVELPIIASRNTGINFGCIETATTYEFKGGIVCKKKGIYGIGVTDLGSAGINGKNCTSASFSLTVINNDKHLYLHQYALNITLNTAEQQHGYDFKVQ